MNPILSICVPCYNKGDHIVELVRELDALSDIAEVCVFDNGSTDGLADRLTELDTRIALRQHRVEPRGSIDYGWLSALGMAKGQFLKLQLGDDRPNPGAIREAIERMQADPGIDYLISKPQIHSPETAPPPAANVIAYFARADALREQLGKLHNEQERADFLFTHYARGNSLGDINGLIFRAGALNGLSALGQSYYGCITHPDAEILSYLVANRRACYFPTPLASYCVSAQSPMSKAKDDPYFRAKVYDLPEATHMLNVFLDPGFAEARKAASSTTFWRSLGHSLWWLFKRLVRARRA